MSIGTYEEFRDALRAFESGWDRTRYETGEIQDWQLDQWAGGSVDQFFPDYTNWSQLTDDEWDAMSYRSMNSLGFVGYQFGEALLIDLGYYDDDLYYGNGAASNTWDGTWTGKNGVDSLEEFMTADAQEVAIQEAFGFNLNIIEEGLANAGQSLDDYLGTTRTYVDGGVSVDVTLTLSGILAAAHLRGAYGTLDLLLNDTVSTDEYGTSILKYVQQFGDYDTPSVTDAIAFFEDRLTGDEGLGGSGNGGAGSYGTANVTLDSADVAITWAWGHDDVVTNFDPASDTIFVNWFSADDLNVTEVNGSVVFAVPSNDQSTTLQGVSLNELSSANFTILDATAAQEILALVGDGSQSGGGDTGGDTTGGDTGGDTTGGDSTGDGGQTVTITWAWGQDAVVTDFNPETDTVFIDWIGADSLEVSEVNGSAVFAVPSNDQSTTLQDVSLADLSTANFVIRDATAEAEVYALIGGTAPPDDTPDPQPDPQPDTGEGSGDRVAIAWNWGVQETVQGFDPASDVFEFGQLQADQVAISESAGDLVIEVLDNGGHSYRVENIQAEDLSLANLDAAAYNDVLHDENGVIDQLNGLGFDDALI